MLDWNWSILSIRAFLFGEQLHSTYHSTRTPRLSLVKKNAILKDTYTILNLYFYMEKSRMLDVGMTHSLKLTQNLDGGLGILELSLQASGPAAREELPRPTSERAVASRGSDRVVTELQTPLPDSPSFPSYRQILLSIRPDQCSSYLLCAARLVPLSVCIAL